MEFKFRAVDNRPTPTSYPPPPLSSLTFFSERSLLDGSPSMVPTYRLNNAFRMPLPAINASEALRRELEKEQIRREIIGSEIARRRELEEEVRRELALERGWGITVHRTLASTQGFSFEERVAMLLNRSRMNSFDNVYSMPQPQLPQLMGAPPEFKSSPKTNKDKIIKLARPDPELYGAKRKAMMAAAVDDSNHAPFVLKKKPKEEWSCALCQVSATSERGLNEHLQGRKHKAKETALRMQKIGLDAKAAKRSLQPGITWGGINQTLADKGVLESKNKEQLLQKSHKIKGLKNDDGTTSAKEAGDINAMKKRKMKFWCKICQVGTGSLTVMEDHKNGRKHLSRMKKLGQKHGSGQLATSVSSEAPVLIKDTVAVDKETEQNITHVLNKETIIKTVECFSDSDEASPVDESNEDGAGE